LGERTQAPWTVHRPTTVKNAVASVGTEGGGGEGDGGGDGEGGKGDGGGGGGGGGEALQSPPS